MVDLKKFLSAEGTSLMTHARIYENDAGKKAHLVPVIHFGEEEYYKAILEYIGDIPCLYELFGSKAMKNQDKKSLIKNVDDFIAYYEDYETGFWKEAEAGIQSYYENYLSQELKAKWEETKKSNMAIPDQRYGRLVQLMEKQFFGIHFIHAFQLLLCQGAGLVHQFSVIGPDEIAKHENWIHADTDVKKIIGDIDTREIFKELLADPSDEWVAMRNKEIMNLVGMFGGMKYLAEATPSQVREVFCEVLVENNEEIQKALAMIPKFLFEERNRVLADRITELFEKNGEIVVFYGASHMGPIEQHLLENGFHQVGIKSFEAFGYDPPE